MTCPTWVLSQNGYGARRGGPRGPGGPTGPGIFGSHGSPVEAALPRAHRTHPPPVPLAPRESRFARGPNASEDPGISGCPGGRGGAGSPGSVGGVRVGGGQGGARGLFGNDDQFLSSADGARKPHTRCKLNYKNTARTARPAGTHTPAPGLKSCLVCVKQTSDARQRKTMRAHHRETTEARDKHVAQSLKAAAQPSSFAQ